MILSICINKTTSHVPVNELIDSQSIESILRHPMLLGRVPWRDVESIYNNRRLLSLPMVVGRAPFSLTLDIFRIDKLDIEPMVVGMEPKIWTTCIIIKTGTNAHRGICMYTLIDIYS
jgi:hypothetical protein